MIELGRGCTVNIDYKVDNLGLLSIRPFVFTGYSERIVILMTQLNGVRDCAETAQKELPEDSVAPAEQIS